MILVAILFVLRLTCIEAALTISPTGHTVAISEASVDGDTVYNGYSASGQGTGALYYYTLESISPNPGVGNEPFVLVQGLASDTNTADVLVQLPPGLDFETTQQWQLDVIVTDLADPSAGTATAVLTVDINDSPDPPTFLNLPGTGTVPELVTTSEIVKRVTVSDDENPADASGITITILSMNPAGGPFLIDSVVSTAGEAVATIKNTVNPGFDYEFGTTTWDITLEATDVNNDVSTAILTVNVLDENEPVVISNLPDTQVVGETMHGQIFVVETLDVDINDTASVPTFTMTTNPANGPFTIDALGNIEVVPPGLNYNFEDYWTLTITIVDDDGNTDTQPLYVQVTDQNSGPLILNLPSTVNVSEDSAGGLWVFTLNPYDVDGDTAICTISSNPNDGNFVFDTLTYEITLSATPSLDYQITPTYGVTIVCNDGMDVGPMAKLTINIIEVNEPPVILNLPATVTVPEDAINAAWIFIANGYDDDGDNLDFTISVTPSSGQSKFFVADFGENDGNISIVNSPNFDYEDVDQYIVIVTASDGEYTATGTLNVDITDVNEPPQFDLKPQTLYLDENLPINTILSSIDLSVTDIDDDPWNLTFAVVPSTYSAFFKVNQVPRLKVASLMDYEAVFPEPFNIEVSVTDTDGNSDILTIEVYLQNVNDNEPEFAVDPYVVTVSESLPGGTTILTVAATDDDGDNIEYSIDPPSLYVEVDEVTGELILKQPLNREALPWMIRVEVIATDDGTPSLQGFTYVNITIKDINDNEPLFEKTFYNWEIRYDTSIGSYVNSVKATDSDRGANADVTYSLLLDHVFYDMDGVGKVSVNSILRPEFMYLLFCRAEDSGKPLMISDITTIRIDTFIPELVLINVHLGITEPDFTTAVRTQMLDSLNAIYPPWQFRISAVKTEDVVVSSRRLLASNAVLEMYALVDNSTDGIDNLDKLKNFVYVDTLVNSMTIDDEGSASVVLNGLDIVLVEPTYPTKVSDVTFNWWLDTTEGLAVTCLLSAIACIFLLSMCLCCCWKCCGDRIGAWFKKCCKRKKKKLELVDERTSGWEMRSNDVGPSERPQMDTTPEEVVETSPVVPKPQTVPPGGNYTLGGVFDYRYAGRPHPSGPQHLKQKEMPPLILPPTPTSSKSAPKKEGESSQSLQPLLKKASPMLHRQPGRVSPEVGGIENSSSSTVDESKYDGNVYDKVTGKTYNFNTESGESSWDPPSRRLPPHGAHNFDV